MASSPKTILVNHQLRREHALILERIEALEAANAQDDSLDPPQAVLKARVTELLHSLLKPHLDTIAQQQSELHKQIDTLQRANNVVEDDLRDRLAKLESVRSRHLEQMAVTEGELYRKALASCQEKMQEMAAELRRRNEDTQQAKRQLSLLSRQVQEIGQQRAIQAVDGQQAPQYGQASSQDRSSARERSGQAGNCSNREIPESPTGKFSAIKRQKPDAHVSTQRRGAMDSPVKALKAEKASSDTKTHPPSSVGLPLGKQVVKRSSDAEPTANDMPLPTSKKPRFDSEEKSATKLITTGPAQDRSLRRPEQHVDKPKRSEEASSKLPTVERDAKGRFKRKSKPQVARKKSVRREAVVEWQKVQTRRSNRTKEPARDVRGQDHAPKRSRKEARIEGEADRHDASLQSSNKEFTTGTQSKKADQPMVDGINPWLAAFRRVARL